MDNITQENLEDTFAKLEFIVEGKINRQTRNKKTKLDTYQEKISMFEYKRILEEQEKQDE